MLTRKQHDLLMFIDQKLRETGVSPSFDEMRDALNLKSKSGIHRLIGNLEERGFIRRLPHRARALEILKLPDNATPGLAYLSQQQQSPPPLIVHAHFDGPRAATSITRPPEKTPEPAASIDLPLYGKIAAGAPIEALRDPSSNVAIPTALLGSGDHYALTIDGDSMIEAGILDGDIVLVRQCDSVENGAIAVALVDENEVTLKRLYHRGQEVSLEAANTRYPPRVLPASRVRVQGRLVGLLRRY